MGSKKVCLLGLIFLVSVVLSKSYITTTKGNLTFVYKTHDGIKVEEEEDEEPNDDMKGGRLIIDRPKGPEKVGPLGFDFGGNVGVGPAENVRCLEDRPRGEDGKEYCKFNSEQRKNMKIENGYQLVVLTTNGTQTDAHKDLLRSAQAYKYEIRTLGANEYVDSATQLKLLQKEVQEIAKENKEKIILFVDGPDALLLSGPPRVVEELIFSEADILVSAADIPDDTKAMKRGGAKDLDAGAFAGKSGSIDDLFNIYPEESDLQSLFSKAFKDESVKRKFKIEIDDKRHLFQNLNSSSDAIEVNFIGKETYVQNNVYKSVPVVLRVNDLAIQTLNRFRPYLARSWDEESGCKECWENMISLEDTPDEELPTVAIGVFIENPTPFLEEFLLAIDDLEYPKKRMHLFLHNDMEFHNEEVENWFETQKKEYKSVRYISSHDNSTKEWHAKNKAIEFCLDRECDYLFFIDADARLDNVFTLKLLIEQNRDILAPMLTRPEKAWSNFWGALTDDGFYARSEDYMYIASNVKRGLWNVPYISNCFLIKRSVLENEKTKPSFINNLLDPDMAFCQNMRDNKKFLHVTNRVDFGHLVNSENFNTSNFNPELWQMFDNRWDWEKRYLHENFSQAINESSESLMPCPDVYWFPVFKPRYAQEMIDTMENYGQWSGGIYNDLDESDEGFDTVPTMDIRMFQVFYEDEWLEILRVLVHPLQKKAFPGYEKGEAPKANESFVVRYRPNEQSSLRPHDDCSTYSINIGLNRPGIDFEGGGTKFHRYNCSVVNTRVGWMLMHPGQLTHFHEGLPVTNGTRYILVTFVDPPY